MSASTAPYTTHTIHRQTLPRTRCPSKKTMVQALETIPCYKTNVLPHAMVYVTYLLLWLYAFTLTTTTSHLSKTACSTYEEEVVLQYVLSLYVCRVMYHIHVTTPHPHRTISSSEYLNEACLPLLNDLVPIGWPRPPPSV